MTVNYRELTLEQQAGLAKSKSFEYEYNYFVANLESTALPSDATRTANVTELDALVNEAQTEYINLLQQLVDSGVVLIGELATDAANLATTGIIVPKPPVP